MFFNRGLFYIALRVAKCFKIFLHCYITVKLLNVLLCLSAELLYQQALMFLNNTSNRKSSTKYV